jgi:hypothetical protein
VCRLCALLSAMLSVPALRQNTLIVLAINVELVPRMWFSYLKVINVSLSTLNATLQTPSSAFPFHSTM